jgi:excisionase family DNA binding protein
MEELFTLQEVAIKLKLSTNTLYRYVEKGIIQHQKIGRKIRFTNANINDFLTQRNVKGEK